MLQGASAGLKGKPAGNATRDPSARSARSVLVARALQVPKHAARGVFVGRLAAPKVRGSLIQWPVWSAFHQLVWSGLEWFGVVWSGLEWFGVVWSGLEWFGVVWSGLEWFGVVWSGGLVQLVIWWFGPTGDLVLWRFGGGFPFTHKKQGFQYQHELPHAGRRELTALPCPPVNAIRTAAARGVWPVSWPKPPIPVEHLALGASASASASSPSQGISHFFGGLP